jgi:integrase
MRLYKRGEVYWFELEFAGRRYQRSTKSRNQRLAGQIASAFHTSLVKGEVGIVDRRPVPAFGEAMREFLAWSQQEHKAHPATSERYRYSSIPLLAFFREQLLDRITPDLVEDYKQRRSMAKHKGKRLRPATVNRELACMRAMFNHAIKRNPDLRNPISKATGVKLLAENNQQERVLTYSEETKYLEKCSPTLRDVATLILETGMRPEEVFTLQPGNLDLDQKHLRVLRGKTPAARRRIELTATALELLERRLAEISGPYLFPNAKDTSRPLPGVQSAHARALRESKVAQFRPYDLRHTWATRAAEAGVDLITLAAMMGHSRIQMVLRYAHPTQDHQTGAMAKVVEHKTNQRAKEKAKQEAAERRRATSGLHVVAKEA